MLFSSTERPSASDPASRMEIADRSGIEPTLQWKLENIFAARSDWESEFSRVESAIREVAAFQGTLGKSAASLNSALEGHSRVGESLDRVYVYAHLLRDEDTRDPEGQALAERASRLGTRFAEAAAFLEPEILAISPDRLASFLESGELELWRHYLEDLLRKKEHTLSPREEEMLAMAGEVTRVPRTVFGMLNDADLTFGTIRDEKGQEVEITHGRYSLFLESNDRRVRRDTWLALYQSYAAHKNTFASLLSGAIKRDIFFARARGYSSSLHAALHPANIPVDVFHTLISTVDEKREVVHRAMSMRRRLLAVDDLRVHDLHAPLALADPPSSFVEGGLPAPPRWIDPFGRGISRGSS